MFKQKKRSLGFTLIETLLVIAIIGIIAALSLTAYQRRTFNTKVDKTALQVQQLLQAGSAYFTDNGCWPASDPLKSSCKDPSTAPSFDPYIPIAGKTNPWGYDYIWAPVPDSSGQPANNLFQIETRVPDLSTAHSIAGKLPNAIGNVDTVGQNIVIAQVPTPGQNSLGGLQVKEVNTDFVSGLGNSDTHNIDTSNCPNGLGCNGNITVGPFDCPAGWTGSLVISSFAYTSTIATSTLGSNYLPVYSFSLQPNCNQQSNNQYICNVVVSLRTAAVPVDGTLNLCSLFGPASNSNCKVQPKASSAPSTGRVNVTYLAYCRPPLTTNQKSVTNNDPFF